MSTEPVKLKDLPMPRGYAKLISHRKLCSETKVYHVKMGYAHDDEIKIELLKLAAEENKRRKKIEEQKSQVLDLFDFPIEF